VVPLILPIAAGYEVNPIHLGVIFLTNLQIGYCTPPVGLNLFLASYRFKRPIIELYRASLPFLGLLLITLVLITYFPWLSLTLVNWFG
jgi:TRAP-type C4-dicarboxylate transport system permease large subunit